jgi:hypothetical protein
MKTKTAFLLLRKTNKESTAFAFEHANKIKKKKKESKKQREF